MEERSAVWQREEEAALVGLHLFGFDLLVTFGLLYFLELGHDLWGICHLVRSRATCRHDEGWLAREETLGSGALSSNCRIDGPFSTLCVLDSDALGRGLPYLCVEGKLFSGSCIEVDTLAHEREFELIATLDGARNLLVMQVKVRLGRMESDLKVKVRVRIDVSALWLYCEILFVHLRVPFEMSLDIAEVAELEALGESTSLDDTTEGDDLIHELELNAV